MQSCVLWSMSGHWLPGRSIAAVVGLALSTRLKANGCFCSSGSAESALGHEMVNELFKLIKFKVDPGPEALWPFT